MKLLCKAILVSALIVGFSASAHARYTDGDLVPDEVLLPLMAWVEAETGVKVPVLPQVIASRTYLNNIVRTMGRIAGRAQAVYVGGKIVLDHRRFDHDDRTEMSFLVHELVHYAQSFQTHRRWACPQEKEFEAYTLQNKWLEASGGRPYVRASWIERMSSCAYGNGGVSLAVAR